MKVTEFMTKDVTTCRDTQTVADAAKAMLELGVSVMPILDSSDKLVGIVTQSDFIGREVEIPHALASIKRLFGMDYNLGDVEDIYKKAKNKPLSEIMTKNVTTVTSDYSLTAVVELMMKKQLKRIPVCDGDKLVGIITRKDILKAFESVK
ncbi:CBS domain-containing protein [Halobacteriovorax sp. GFR7]|uniref:CBS domain-containing protein n=1 Tax=unclassified Halobacteriovorax TaxID=2639665 RepID=UPI003D964FB5